MQADLSLIETETIAEDESTPTDHEAWLAKRRTGIGGSDAAAILGVSPWRTAFETWLDKTGQLHNDRDTESMRQGNRLEDTVADEYEYRTGRKVHRINRMLRSKEHPFMLANLDRRVVGHRRFLECKTTGGQYFYDSDWGPDGSDKIPEYYYPQVQHYLSVTGYDIADVGVLVNGQRFYFYEVPRNDEFITALIKAEKDFWEHVITMTPPPMDYTHKSALDLLKRMYPDVEESKIIDLDFDAFELHGQLTDTKAQIKKLEETEGELNARLRALVGTAAAGRFPDGSGYKRTLIPGSTSTTTRKPSVRFTFVNKLPA